MRIEVFADAAEAAEAAARHIAERAREAVARRGAFTLALSGGSTPLPMLRALASLDVPWPSLRIFQVDERVAPPGDAARNLTGLEASLAAAPPALARLRPMPVEADDLEAAAERYAEALAEAAGSPPALDLVHLGIGDDGHTASLVPGDPVLEVKDRTVSVTAPYRGHRRMTLTYPALDAAREALWLVAGEDKAHAVARLRARDPTIPAGRVRTPEQIVFADEGVDS